MHHQLNYKEYVISGTGINAGQEYKVLAFISGQILLKIAAENARWSS